MKKRILIASIIVAVVFQLASARCEDLTLNEALHVTSGCCSWHGGVNHCSGGRYVCNDGSYSPTCTCYSPPARPAPTARPRPTPTPNLAGFLPNRKLTPGDVLPVTSTELCAAGYTIPELTESEKRAVFRRYRLKKSREYYVDHLIPPSIGGSNGIKNLWPEPVKGKWSWAIKNRLEARLRKALCIWNWYDISDTQRCIASHWIRCYQQEM